MKAALIVAAYVALSVPVGLAVLWLGYSAAGRTGGYKRHF